MTETPATPRDAASLIVHRQGPGGPEILLGRRRQEARFGPGFFVFPGGAVAGDDTAVRPASPLRSEVAAMVGVSCSPAFGRALALAAVRETYEETGLIVGAPGDPGAVEDESWRAMGDAGLAPALGLLDYVGRALTPKRRPLRFHARFFMVEASHLAGALLDEDGELLDLGWYPIDAARELKLMDVTEFMLGEAVDLIAGADPARPRHFFTYTDDGPLVERDATAMTPIR